MRHECADCGDFCCEECGRETPEGLICNACAMAQDGDLQGDLAGDCDNCGALLYEAA
jgi:hypothetical protein